METPRLPFAMEDTIHYLKHHQFIEKVLLTHMAGLLPALPDWRIKQAIGFHLWQDSIQVNEFRARLKELRVSRPEKGINRDTVYLRKFLDTAPERQVLLKAVYDSLKVRLIDIYIGQSERTFIVNDAPTFRLMNQIIAEETEQCEQMKALVQNTAEFDQEKGSWTVWYKKFDESVKALLTRIYEGPSSASPDFELMHQELIQLGINKSILPYPKAARPRAFRINNNVLIPPDNPTRQEEMIWQFGNYVQEMQAAETVGSVLYEVRDMPWEFYFDLSRHLWDEIRHSTMGEVRLQEIGVELTELSYSTANYEWRQEIDPVRRFATLTYVIEVGSFPLKHSRYKGHTDLGDFLSAQALLYDITDETMHVQYGKKWVPELIAKCGWNISVEDLVKECTIINDKRTIQPLQKSS